MIVRRLELRNFRNYMRASLELHQGVNLLFGHNGAGKTNLLEAIYFGATGRSCRTNTDAQVIRFGEQVARVEISTENGDPHTMAVGIERGAGKAFQFDGAATDRFDDLEQRPLVAVFMPDRLALIKDAPGVRRAHFDQLILALWPSRKGDRSSYAQALAQRNALLARGGGDDQLSVWDRELARYGLALMRNRADAIGLLDELFSSVASRLGLGDDAKLGYKPRVKSTDEEGFISELIERRPADRERGYSGHGPHRDDFAFSLNGVDLRTYGSQGQQRVALLSLILAERDAISVQRGRPPLTLLDDVMSELDFARRANLMREVERGGQCVITATEAEHVPSTGSIAAVEVVNGEIIRQNL